MRVCVTYQNLGFIYTVIKLYHRVSAMTYIVMWVLSHLNTVDIFMPLKHLTCISLIALSVAFFVSKNNRNGEKMLLLQTC